MYAVAAAVRGKPLLWTLACGYHATHGYEATRNREGGVRKELSKTGRSAENRPLCHWEAR
jgi:hypothetical protein